MLFYEVKLINPQTKEIYYQSTSKKAELPAQDIMQKYQGALLIINTTSINTEDQKKAA
jgi:hypothetical protein